MDHCPHCEASKYLIDAYAPPGQDVLHCRCTVCFEEWVE